MTKLGAGRPLVLILGDQLTLDNPALDRARQDGATILMIESAAEAAHVWSHKVRLAVFFSAMRHFANQLTSAGYSLDYVTVDHSDTSPISEQIAAAMHRHDTTELVLCEPGEWRLEQDLKAACEASGWSLTLLSDTHFMCTRQAFERWAGQSKNLRMEFFYRKMRKQYDVLMTPDGKPVGERWNFDADNRKGYSKSGPPDDEPALAFDPDEITLEVIDKVSGRFADHPGSLEDFDWPVCRDDALAALGHFIEHRLPTFGTHQDAMWTDTPFGSHALLSSALNLKLLDPLEVVQAAQTAWENEQAPLAAVEGFIRQVMGWREFMRGAYWLDMPKMREANHFKHKRSLPAWYWTGETDMACQRVVIEQTLRYGYAHHIQRLMVVGNFAMMAEVEPQQVEDWFLAIYLDAVEWVELPNVAGMALFADGGRFTSKPYAASGAYIKRMSNYCKGCRYKPEVRSGENACPVTTLYWHFLAEKRAELSQNPRATLMIKNLDRIEAAELKKIQATARKMLTNLDDL
ncbi:MAG: cryptochrome/photolyase family protein [Burkholderiaceae bacterium]